MTKWTNRRIVLPLLLAQTLMVSCSRADERPGTKSVVMLRANIARLAPLHRKLEKPKPGEWLASHKESGQTFAEYLRSRPVTPNGTRKIIYIQPLGEFTEKQRAVVKLTADFMARYFNRSVKIQDDLPMAVIPASARRRNPHAGHTQILSTHVLDKVMRPRLPKDAAAYLAFTATDLWPGEGWNFVFGQASLEHRVGVWSIHRNGDLEAGKAAYRACLLRTLKTATHETGHMFSIKHCTAYSCNMCGSNSQRESDGRPLYLCPECAAKVCWATGADPVRRYKNLMDFCKRQGLEETAAYYEKAIARLGGER